MSIYEHHARKARPTVSHRSVLFEIYSGQSRDAETHLHDSLLLDSDTDHHAVNVQDYRKEHLHLLQLEASEVAMFQTVVQCLLSLRLA